MATGPAALTGCDIAKMRMIHLKALLKMRPEAGQKLLNGLAFPVFKNFIFPGDFRAGKDTALFISTLEIVKISMLR